MRTVTTSLTILYTVLILGCAGSSSRVIDEPRPGANPAGAEARVVGYINAKPVTQNELYRIMAPQLGGQALAEIVLDQLIDQRLAEAGISLEPEVMVGERQMLLASLSTDEDQAIVLLKQMRQQRGLDDARFASLLKRNAALRALIQGEINVADNAVRQAYAMAYGPRYRVRLLMTENMQDARQARAKAVEGQDFSELAIQYSTDSSRSQGGLLSPISPADTSYPKAIRDILPKLALEPIQKRISPILAIDSGFAVLALEQVIPAQDVAYESVEADLRRGVRLQLERVRMQQLARSIMQQANVVVIDPLLSPAWEDQAEAILQGGE